MMEIGYFIDELKTSMFVVEEHRFCLDTEQWQKAGNLNVGDKILTNSRAVAKIVSITKTAALPQPQNIKVVHNHNYFMTAAETLASDGLCDKAPSDPLELIAYQLANKPSHFPNGEPTGNHSGPWVAARYLSSDATKETIAWGRADDKMCAEDAAVSNLKNKLGDLIELNRNNVEISHAYIRKYTKKGRFVNTMSPCIHCRSNYGHALKDKTLGESDLAKPKRGYLAEPL